MKTTLKESKHLDFITLERGYQSVIVSIWFSQLHHVSKGTYTDLFDFCIEGKVGKRNMDKWTTFRSYEEAEERLITYIQTKLNKGWTIKEDENDSE